MKRALIVAAVSAPLLLAVAAQAQTRPLPPGPSAMDRHRWQADQHRYEVDRQRLQADQRQVQARQMETQSRINRLEIQSRNQPDPYVSAPQTLRSPEQEREAREAATARRERTASEVGQIDNWLDRRPN